MSNPRILVVEDNRTTLQVLMEVLRKAGFSVLSAQDTLQGMQTATREQPDLVITDLMMPAGGGEMLIERIKNSGKTMHIPVIVVTSRQEPQVESQALSLGALRLFHKPYDPTELIRAIREILERREP